MNKGYEKDMKTKCTMQPWISSWIGEFAVKDNIKTAKFDYILYNYINVKFVSTDYVSVIL